MKNILRIQFVLFFFIVLLRAQYPAYSEHNVSLYFELTESAVNQLLKTQVFPQPEGTFYDDGSLYGYKVTIIQPGIKIREGEIVFTSEIIGKVTLLGNSVRYSYPIEVSVSIPTGSISANGISGFLQGIPDAINSIPSGPQWLKNIIIGAYNNLELALYPDQFMENINSQIPDDLDINIDDIEFGWVALDGKLQFHVTVPCQSRAPFVELVNLWDETEQQVKIQFRSNVHLRILNIEMYNVSLGQEVANGSATMVIPAPASGQDVGQIVTLTINANYGKSFSSGKYEIRVIFGNDFGWFQKTYSYTILQ